VIFSTNPYGCGSHAVVVHEDDERILQHAAGFEVDKEEADIVFDIFNHAVAGGGFLIEPVIEKALFVFLRSDHRIMRGIEWDVGEEWFFHGVLAVDPCHRRAEEQVLAFFFAQRPWGRFWLG
jgi:hypothetical protein